MAVRPIHRRLLGGRSTPAMRAMLFSLSLALAVLRVGANHAHHAAPVDNLALHANFLYRCSNLHATPSFRIPARPAALLVTVNDAPAREIVGRKLHRDTVSGQNTDEILSHFPRNVRQNLMLVFQFDAKHGIWERLYDRSHHLDGILFAASLAWFLLFRLRLFGHVL